MGCLSAGKAGIEPQDQPRNCPECGIKLLPTEEIDVLICKTDLGEISILANHHPLITVMKKGEIKIKKDNEEKTIFLPFDSILEVKENKARILVMFPI